MSAVQVVVDVPLFHLDRPFTYRVPEALRDTVRLGSRVKVPFGGRRRVDGWVVGFADELPPGARDLIRLVSPVPVFGPRDLALLRWVADRWAGTLADVLRLAVPPRVAAVEAAVDGRAVGGPDGERPGPAPDDPLAALVARGWAGAVLWRPLPGEDRGARAVAMVEAALAAGKGALVITPEVAAGSDVGDAVRKSFPEAADLSSDLPDRRRYRAWVELRTGRKRLAVGGRSAVLAPVPRLGCILVDDEANRAHKEQRTPRYHAREVALRRAAIEGATCVLTATVPSAEAVAAVRAGQARLLAPDRAV
jgi:primosomal protein N' (replication factor Y) (superfamily II helicase)